MAITIKHTGQLTKGHKTDTGYDLYAQEDIRVHPQLTVQVHTGVAVEFPEGYGGNIRPRSSTSKKGLLVHEGTIDNGYRGEIIVTVTNLNKYMETKIKSGDRIAQLVIEKVIDADMVQVESVDQDTDRGDKGFGSTGR